MFETTATYFLVIEVVQDLYKLWFLFSRKSYSSSSSDEEGEPYKSLPTSDGKTGSIELPGGIGHAEETQLRETERKEEWGSTNLSFPWICYLLICIQIIFALIVE